MTHKIVRRIPRPDAQAVKLLGELGVATVHEAQGRTGADAAVHAARFILRPGSSGPAVTVSCHPGDNLMIHAAVEVLPTGRRFGGGYTLRNPPTACSATCWARRARRTAWSV